MGESVRIRTNVVPPCANLLEDAETFQGPSFAHVLMVSGSIQRRVNVLTSMNVKSLHVILAPSAPTLLDHSSVPVLED